MKRLLLTLLLSAPAAAATFGSVVTVTGGATDLVLDEGRNRLYIVNNTQNRVDVYALAQRRYLTSIPVDSQPLSAAISRSGKFLYVTAYGASLLDVVDLDSSIVVARRSLPANPEGVAVGADERVLITTTGSGTNNAENRLLLFDPSITTGDSLSAIATTLPAPATPQVPAPSSRVYMSTRSNLTASRDGNWIIGLNNPSTTARQVFVYEVASASILRSRTVASISNVLSVSPDGSKFMAGLSLFDASSLAILAQQNTANSMFPFAANANFNTQQNQGGSIFAPDNALLYSAFNITPVTSTAGANTSQLMLSDPDNLLIQNALQLPENLTGKMVVTSNGTNLYALSQSGFMIIPISTMADSPLAAVDTPAIFLTNDQCGVTSGTRKAQVTIRNAGKGRMTASASVVTTGPTATFPIGGQAGAGAGAVVGGGGAGGGAGAGAPGAGVPIILPVGPGGAGGGVIVLPGGTVPTTATGTTTTTTQQTAVTQTAPSVSVVRRSDTETVLEFTYNSNAARSLGTTAPVDFTVQSPEAINVPWRIRAYQNNRNAEARGDIYVRPTSVSTTEGLVDIVVDAPRKRVYIANSGMNRIEVFDAAANQFLDPIKVGQLPRSIAMLENGRILYVANTGGESIDMIDLEAGQVTGRIKFPPVSYNASFALNTPSVIAATLSGLQIVMSDGTLWKAANGMALPRPASSTIGATAITAPRTLVASPGGEYALLLGGTGTAYLFDASADDYVLSQSVVSTPIQGYFGPVSAGPGGQYFVVNGRILNASLTPIATNVTSTRPVAAVTAVSANQIARYTQPVLSSATAVVTDVPLVELVDVTTGISRGGVTTLEGPLSTQVGTNRVNVSARTMAVDASSMKAYVLSASGLSIVQLPALATGGPGPGGAGGTPGTGGPTTAGIAVPSISANGIVNPASYTSGVAPGSQIAIFGQNLATQAVAPGTPLPTYLGGVCVTVNNSPIPLVLTSPGQINAQLPTTLAAGKQSLVIRAVDRGVTSTTQSVTVAKYAPAVFLNSSTGQAAVFHADGKPVSKDNKASRDEPLVMYATGLGATKPAAVTGQPSPENAVTDAIKVYFGDPKMSQAEVIVDWSGLLPGYIGVYQLNLRVPGSHLKGDALPVLLRIGNIDSPTTGSAAPAIAVD